MRNNTFTVLTYSQLYSKIEILSNKKTSLYYVLANLDELDDEEEINELNSTLNSIDSYLNVLIYEMTLREEFIFNIFGTEENQFEMCLN